VFYKDVRQKTPKLGITREFKLTVVETVIFSCFSESTLTETLPDPGKNYVPEGPVQVGIQYSYDLLYVYLKGRAAEMQTSAYSNLMGPGITFPLPV